MGAFDNRTPVNKNAGATTETAKAEALAKAAELEKSIAALEKMGGDEEIKKSIEGLKKCLETAKAAAGVGNGGGGPAEPPKPEDIEAKKALDEVVSAQKALGADVSAIAKELAEIKSALLPKNTTVSNMVVAEGTRETEMPKVVKMLEGVTKSLEGVQAASAEQATRIEKIEKARAAPSSEQPGGGTMPVKKSMWSGLGLLGG